MILKNQPPGGKERIKLEYTQINLIKRTHTGELQQSKTDPNVYYQSEADSIIYQNPNGAGLSGDINEVEPNKM